MVDLVFENGQVLTMDNQNSIHEALAVKNNKIHAIGSNEEMAAYITEKTEVVDLKGRTLMPGLIDAHAHLELYGTNALGVNCKTVKNIEDLKRIFKKRAEETPKGEWIRGWGYNQNYLEEGRHPTRWDLDEVSTEHPIIVVRTCGHISVVNSKALEHAGLDESSQNPYGGKYVRDSKGALTGLLLEAAHMKMFLTTQYSKEEILKGLSIASQDYIRMGITSIHDAGGYDTNHFNYLYEAVSEGHLKQRVYTLYGALNDSPSIVKNGLAAGIRTGIGDEYFRIGPAKVFIDGSSSGPTAKTKEPYTSNPDESGILYLNQEELNSYLVPAHKEGWQITAHAIGDRAVEMMINCIEAALKESPRKNHRHRIEHSAMTPPDLLQKMKDLEIIPIPNPAFIYEFGDGYIRDYGERIHTMFPTQSFVEEGIKAAIGSDSPITTFNPFVGIATAVNRLSKKGESVGEGQKTGLIEVLKMYTINGAYASFEEDLKGSLERGKLADLVVLNEDIFKVEPTDLIGVKVDMTILDGKVVYQ